MDRPEETAPDEPPFDLRSSDLPVYPGETEPGSEAVGEPEPQYDNPDFLSQFLAEEEFHHARPARRWGFPVVTVVVLLILAGVVAVYLNRDRLFGPSAPSPGTPVAAVSAAEDLEGSIAPIAESAETPPAEAPPPPAEARLSATPAPPRASLPVAPLSPRPKASPSAPPAAATAAEFTRVLDISWTRRPGGMTIEVETDGLILKGRYKYFRLEGEKNREVVKLKGVVERYRQSEIQVSGAPVGRIRVGYHVNQELHVVLDMLDSTSHISTVRAQGKKLEIFIER